MLNQSINETGIINPWQHFDEGYCIFVIGSSIWVILIDTLLLRTILKHSTLRGAQFTILSATCAMDNILLVLQLIVICINNYFEKCREQHILIWTILECLLNAFFLNSVVVSLLDSVNLFVMVKHALRYEEIFTSKRSKILITIVCVSTFCLYGVLFYYGYSNYLMISFLVFSGIVMLTIRVYATITGKRSNNARRNSFDQRHLKRSDKAAYASHFVFLLSVLLMFGIAGYTYVIWKVKSYVSVKTITILYTSYVILKPIAHLCTFSRLRFFVRKDYNDYQDSFFSRYSESQRAPRLPLFSL